jgi:hypothetical protein
MRSLGIINVAILSFLGHIGGDPAQAQEPAATAPPAKAPAATAEQIAHWIRQLGDDSFLVREDATRSLIAAGAPAEVSVKAALETHDPEVRYRALKILREIDRGQLAQRRAAFLEGDVEQMRTNAASWVRLEEVVGNTRESRELFLAMQQDAEELLNELEQAPDRCSARISQLYQQDALARRSGKGLGAGVIYAMIFAAGDERIKLDAAASSRCVSLVTRNRSGANLEKNDAFRRLLGRWIARETGGPQQLQMLRLAQQFQLEEGSGLARKIIEGTAHATIKSQALMMLGQLGGPDDVAILEKHVADDTRIGAVRRVGDRTHECRFGDVALAMCLVLSEQKPSEYGFASAPDGRPAAHNFTHYTFDSEDARRAARQKWSEFRQAQAAESK